MKLLAIAPQLVAVMGAECSGKTTLVQALAEQLGCLWVSEPLRDFCFQHARTPQPQEQRQILLTQLRVQRQALAQARALGLGWVICDTTALQTACYSEYYFAQTALTGRAQALHRRYALTLLLAPDLPWQADGVQRDGPRAQHAVHALLQRALQQGGHPSVSIHGAGSQRLARALVAIGQATRQPLDLQWCPHRGCLS